MTGEGLRWLLGGAVYVWLFAMLVGRLAPAAAGRLRAVGARAHSVLVRAAAGPGRARRRSEEGRASSLAVALLLAVLLALTFAFPAQVGTPIRYLLRWAF